MERRERGERPRAARPRMRWLVLLGALVVAVGVAGIVERSRDDDRQQVAERVGEALAALPGAVELRPIEPAPEGGGAAYAGRLRGEGGGELRFGVVVGADLAATQLPRALPDLAAAAEGRGWLLLSDATADPDQAGDRARLQAVVVRKLRELLPGRAAAP